MIIIITGATHTGKTLLAQKLLEKYHYPYLSLDHLKMGLIRSKNTTLSPYSADQELTSYLWPIALEIIKTTIENNQNLIVEGVYIPFNWKSDFTSEYLKNIKYICLIMSKRYINNHFNDIISFEKVIEKRFIENKLTKDKLIRENEFIEECVKQNNLDYILIDDKYEINI